LQLEKAKIRTKESQKKRSTASATVQKSQFKAHPAGSTQILQLLMSLLSSIQEIQ